MVCLGDGVEVPLSRSHYKEVKNRHMSKIRKLLRRKKNVEITLLLITDNN